MRNRLVDENKTLKNLSQITETTISGCGLAHPVRAKVGTSACQRQVQQNLLENKISNNQRKLVLLRKEIRHTLKGKKSQKRKSQKQKK